MNRKVGVLFAFQLLFSTQLQCSADSPLQGRIEQRNAAARLSRPAMPSRPLGDAMEQVHSGSARRHKSGFNLSASSVTDQLDKDAFGFHKLNPQSSSGAKTGLLKDGVDAQDKELVIAWEEWHRRLCQTIYKQWLSYGNIPGDGLVTLSVSSDGDIDFELQDFHVNPFEQFSPQQRDLFDQCVSRTLQMVSHSDILAFPERSQRKEVTLSTKFSFTEQEDGPQGYSWKRGDYERINEAH